MWRPLRPEGGRGQPGVCLSVFPAKEERRRLGIASGDLGRWSLPILADLDHRWKRFTALQAGLRPVTPRALSLALKQMLAVRLVDRRLESGFPPIPFTASPGADTRWCGRWTGRASLDDTPVPSARGGMAALARNGCLTPFVSPPVPSQRKGRCMRKLAMIAAAVAMAIAMPALAKPGKGQGHHGPAVHAKGKSGAHGTHARTRPRTVVRTKAGNRYGVNACPPGLAAKGNGCLPPGQARKIFNVGQRIPTGYNFYTPYSDIPMAYRDRYGIPTGQQYIYRDQSVYVVDPTTNLVSRIIDLID